MMWALKAGRKDGGAGDNKREELRPTPCMLRNTLSFPLFLSCSQGSIFLPQHIMSLIFFSPFCAIEGCVSGTGVKGTQLPSGMLQTSLGKDCKWIFEETVTSLEGVKFCGPQNSKPLVIDSFFYRWHCLVPTVHKVIIGSDIFNNSTTCPCSLNEIQCDDWGPSGSTVLVTGSHVHPGDFRLHLWEPKAPSLGNDVRH